MNARRRWLAFLLFVTVAVAFWPAREERDERVGPRKRGDEAVRMQVTAAAAAAAAAGSSLPQVANDKQVRLADMQSDLFPVETWAPPPGPHAPPPPPVPPPLPFEYLGRWEDAGRQTLFLMQGDRPVPVRPGQILSGNWRVDEITERAVVFTYLPLNMGSTLGITP